MIDGVDKSPIGHLDLGADRDKRETLCIVHPRCVELAGHGGLCRMFVGEQPATPDFGPEASKRRRY